MGLAVIMILLLGVMGAGLLTFVSRDLNTVIEENRGQRAFEVAEAGIGAAKRQLAANVVREHYDGLTDIPDIQWSLSQGGLTLDNLDGAGTTADSVNVTIEYLSATDSFRVISDGTYGTARRKIEARFDGVVAGGGGGDTIGHPLYYTPSDIRIESQVQLNAISMFSEQDILIQGVTDPRSFVLEYESPGDTLSIPGTDDALCNWKSDVPLKNCFVDATGGYNTVGRTWDKKNGTTENYLEPGFAAEGKICGFPAGTAKGECGITQSAADGVYGYDSTTGNKTMSRTLEGYTNPWGNNLAFVDKGNLEPNEAGTITYPFPRPTPIPEGFKEEACRPLALAGCTPSASNDYFVGSPSPTDWGNLLSSNPNRIAFVDAQNQNITFNSGGATKGILVVWCGHLTQTSKFQGIILNLHGDGSAFGSTNCDGNGALGTYTNGGTDCQCWTYADGGTTTKAGLTFLNGSKIFFYSGDWSFLSDLFEGPPPTSFELQGWRELYE
jgi:hypothetical protein